MDLVKLIKTIILNSPFLNRGFSFTSLRQREVRRNFIKFFKPSKLLYQHPTKSINSIDRRKSLEVKETTTIPAAELRGFLTG